MSGVSGRVRVEQQWPDMQAMSSLQRLRGAAQKRCPDKGKRMTPGAGEAATGGCMKKIVMVLGLLLTGCFSYRPIPAPILLDAIVRAAWKEEA